MMTWSYCKNNVILIVTADNVQQAIHELNSRGIPNILPVDLIPVVTHHRWVRILKK
jgi:hypothetical protein